MRKLYTLLLSFIFLFSMSVKLTARSSDNGKDINLVFIGNSITQGVQLGGAEYAPPAIAAGILEGYKGVGSVKFFNNGVSGKTTFDHIPGTGLFTRTIEAADGFYSDKDAQLVFSIMIGTNDSAVTGPNGSPVEREVYIINLMSIMDSLLNRYPDAVVVLHHPVWYSPNTYNTSQYLQEGLDRLRSYIPAIDRLAREYRKKNFSVYVGDSKAHGYFEKHYKELMIHENGQEGIFFLHPNRDGAAKLAEFWTGNIYKSLRKSGAL
ncbi:MAG: GDSL-type esterase/lipase family protein [Rikenellaceae bacterium]|nr:GDSL-type esterase/lipase family protein [Rikenellaceae bacterium]